jgi:hypothetical protein
MPISLYIRIRLHYHRHKVVDLCREDDRLGQTQLKAKEAAKKEAGQLNDKPTPPESWKVHFDAADSKEPKFQGPY